MYKLGVWLILLSVLTVNAQSPFEPIPLNQNAWTRGGVSASGQVDIVIEPQTYAPIFYQGRREPTAGNLVKIIALPRLSENNPNKPYSYTFYDANRSYTTTDTNFITIPTPPNNFTIKVEVKDSTNKVIALGNETINLSEMKLVLYEQNPLRGLQLNAIGSNFQVIGEELTVRAAPYFSAPKLNDANLRQVWSFGGQTVLSEKPWEITLTELKSNTRLPVRLEVSNYKTLGVANVSFIATVN